MKVLYKFSLALIFLLSFQAFAQKEALILHTNDLHSQMEPITDSKLGGMVRLATIIDDERQQHPNLFLFDAGDFWQGTPYFNFFGGQVEIAMMNAMKYDAVTLGNHQFDIPMNFLAQRLSEADFKIVLSNYDVKKTPLKKFITPYTIIEKNGVKVGVLAVCVDLKGLAMPENYDGMVYKDPVKTTNKMAKKLKKAHCDLIVCLSHLGYEDNYGIDDIELAKKSKNIDIIIGGHSHNLVEKVSNNLKEKPVTIVQAEKSGAYLGRIDITIK